MPRFSIYYVYKGCPCFPKTVFWALEAIPLKIGMSVATDQLPS